MELPSGLVADIVAGPTSLKYGLVYSCFDRHSQTDMSVEIRESPKIPHNLSVKL